MTARLTDHALRYMYGHAVDGAVTAEGGGEKKGRG